MSENKEIQKPKDKNKLSFTKMSNGISSITRIFMIISFSIAVGLIIAGVLCSLLWDKEIADNVYNFAFKIFGGGVLQYGLTKVNDTLNKKHNSKSETEFK